MSMTASSTSTASVYQAMQRIADFGIAQGWPRERVIAGMVQVGIAAGWTESRSLQIANAIYSARVFTHQPGSTTVSQLTHHPVASFEAGISGFGAGITGLIKRLAVGALGATLIVVGVLMIGGEATLSSAVGRFGRELGKVVRR